MDQQFLHLILAIFIGGLIGGSTNMLAIKMLFRPHQPLYIGKNRIPFTPGLIPSKQDQLAIKIASVVSDYILTPSVIAHAFTKVNFQKKLHDILKAYWSESMKKGYTLETLIDSFGFDKERIIILLKDSIVRQMIHVNTRTNIKEAHSLFIKQFGQKQISSIIPKVFQDTIEQNVDHTIELLLEYFSKQLNENQTKIAMIQMLEESFDIKNPLMKKLFFSVIADDQILQSIIKKLQKAIESDTVKQLVKDSLQKNWDSILESTILDLIIRWPEQAAQFERVLTKTIHKTIQTALHTAQLHESLEMIVRKLVNNFLHTPLQKYEKTLEPYVDQIIQAILSSGLEYVQRHVDTLIASINIHEVVRSQVAAFPSKKLEAMILQVANRELLYITYFGVLLGGLMGILQYLLSRLL
ncbi:hypothetical protein BHU72_01305 [Desulfuribacillus stibiiarsenatis]|uniref:DUF445 domain-containing protein n=1 Tax=Desulfuribacillus stibiiarsenatis TaxID=1390249 RepID=A0A1E5L9W3_9FIRM|nr:DUF445 family protein [Desulfuribacillus stibiiarsenatis]OEH86927.1 hypothetical protein BHU72_01305 [Desulfuribacillus stibiiarsenatis]